MPQPFQGGAVMLTDDRLPTLCCGYCHDVNIFPRAGAYTSISADALIAVLR